MTRPPRKATTVPKEVLAQETRRVIELHTRWDQMHAFLTFHWLEAEQRITVGTYGAIDTNIETSQYMSLMMRLAADRRRDDQGKDFPAACAYMLRIESFGVNFNPATATAEERAKFEDDRRNRTFHLRDDAVESVNAWTADVHGRLFAATQKRGGETIHERMYSPGHYPGGQLIEALLVVTSIGAVKSWNLPVIPGTPNIARTLVIRKGESLLSDLDEAGASSGQ